MSATGQRFDELISTPLASNTLAPATSDQPLALVRSTSCMASVAISLRNMSAESMPWPSSSAMMLFWSTAKSSNSRSKWRASRRTELSRLSRPLSMAFCRKRSTVSPVPMAIAAISTKPPTISHVSGAPRHWRSSTRKRAVHRIDAPIPSSRGMQDAAKPPRPRYQSGLGKCESERNQRGWFPGRQAMKSHRLISQFSASALPLANIAGTSNLPVLRS